MNVTMPLALVLSAGLLVACPNQTPPPPPIAPLSPEEPPAPEPVVGDPMTDTTGAEPGGVEPGGVEPGGDESDSAHPPGACETTGGVCGPTSCAERGASEAEGTCYLQGEPQTNLFCCDG